MIMIKEKAIIFIVISANKVIPGVNFRNILL